MEKQEIKTNIDENNEKINRVIKKHKQDQSKEKKKK